MESQICILVDFRDEFFVNVEVFRKEGGDVEKEEFIFYI